MLNLNSISSILRQSTGRDKWNILTYSTHERYDQNICELNAEFYALPGQQVRTWNEQYSKIPPNYHFVKDRLPPHLTFDAIITGNPFVHIPLAVPISKQLHLPIINIFHTDAPLGWSKQNFIANKPFFDQCHHHVFITEYNLISWGFSGEKNCTVIKHGLDLELFNPGNSTRNGVLTVGNDFINRDKELGFTIWREITEGRPVKVIGNTPGLSKPAQTQQDLIRELQASKVYLNTTLRSPLPMSLIEAAACGCAILTTHCNAIPDFFRHGYDCLMFSPQNPKQGREYLDKLLIDNDLCQELGQNARKTAENLFQMSDFVKSWEGVLNNVCSKPFLV